MNVSEIFDDYLVAHFGPVTLLVPEQVFSSVSGRIVVSGVELAGLPVGSIVTDRDGDAWQRVVGGCWAPACGDWAVTTGRLVKKSPFTVLREGAGK